jgi:hypothetical protein
MSTLPALYTVADCYLADLEKLQDLDLDEQTIKDTMEGMIGTVEVKATNVAAFVKNLDSLTDQIKQAEAAMATRRKAIENRADAVREYLLANMQRCGISKIESPYFKIAVCKNPVRVVIDDPDAVPVEFKHHVPPPPPVPDKKLIKAAIESGEGVAGARLQQGYRVFIK